MNMHPDLRRHQCVFMIVYPDTRGDTLTIKGQDWASYQSATPSVRGIDFAFIKATEGTSYVNPKMHSQAEHARAHGLVVGFYHFLRPGNMKAQARYFVEKCASLHGDPLWADWEDPGVSCHDKDTFIKEVIRLRGDTHRVGLYCNTNYWWTRDTTSYCGDSLWIATYNGRPGHPGVQHDWDFHQYTSTPIDTNIGAFSSRSALRAWCEKGSAADTSFKDELMALSDREVYDLVWRHDGVMKSPWGTKDNPTWMPESVIEQIGREVKRARADLAANSAVIDKLADAVGKAGNFDPKALKDEIRAAVAEAVESVSFTPTVAE